MSAHGLRIVRALTCGINPDGVRPGRRPLRPAARPCCGSCRPHANVQVQRQPPAPGSRRRQLQAAAGAPTAQREVPPPPAQELQALGQLGGAGPDAPPTEGNLEPLAHVRGCHDEDRTLPAAPHAGEQLRTVAMDFRAEGGRNLRTSKRKAVQRIIAAAPPGECHRVRGMILAAHDHGHLAPAACDNAAPWVGAPRLAASSPRDGIHPDGLRSIV
mmetsp:Transcript_15010/g.48005  ORF Transcript_15010/g.48005 Transcript_15010/m.48005 type:complete len:215 (-) Transcript_15010:258-902(-)